MSNHRRAGSIGLHNVNGSLHAAHNELRQTWIPLAVALLQHHHDFISVSFFNFVSKLSWTSFPPQNSPQRENSSLPRCLRPLDWFNAPTDGKDLQIRWNQQVCALVGRPSHSHATPNLSLGIENSRLIEPNCNIFFIFTSFASEKSFNKLFISFMQNVFISEALLQNDVQQHAIEFG